MFKKLHVVCAEVRQDGFTSAAEIFAHNCARMFSRIVKESIVTTFFEKKKRKNS